MTTILDKIFEVKRRRVMDARRGIDLPALARSAYKARTANAYRRGSFRQTLHDDGINIIAEFKRASPSKGVINESSDAAGVARQYECGGARAISVLTEEDFFKGSLNDLRNVRDATSLPILRKDFIFDEFQVYEAADAGADAILLIAASLSRADLIGLKKVTEELGMDALVEVHMPDEMKLAADIGANLIGVNNRDLRTFDVSLDISRDLAKLAPDGVTLVAESGLRSQDDLVELKSLGYSAFLIGETLMRSEDPADSLRRLVGPPVV